MPESSEPAGHRHASGTWRALAALLISLLCTSAHGDTVYRWVDADGRVQFGDRPPGAGAEIVDIPAPPQADADLDARRRRAVLLGEILEEDRTARDEDRRSERAAREERRVLCGRARARLAEAQRASYIYEDSGDPANPRILADSERATVEQTLSGEVRRHCGTESPTR